MDGNDALHNHASYSAARSVQAQKIDYSGFRSYCGSTSKAMLIRVSSDWSGTVR